MTSLPDLPGLRDRSGGERRALVDMAHRLGADPDDVAFVIGYETGPRTPFSPAARNPSSGCTGLIQFCEPAAKRLGTTLAELAAMSFRGQLAYVERYFESYRGRLDSLADTYLAVFWPNAMGRSEEFVLAREGAGGYEGLAYEQNSGFDDDGKGYISRGDVVAQIRAYAATPRGRLEVGGGLELDSGSAILLGAVAGAGVVWYSLRRGTGRARRAWMR